MNLTAIVAIAENGVIGKNNDLIWHLPEDLKHFKKLTKGHHIIMGRKTFESIGSKPLPYRTNIVVTRNTDFEAPGCIIVHGVEEAIQKAENDVQPFIVGGAKIYQLALPYIKQMEITIVHQDFEGDTFFPTFDESDWTLTRDEKQPTDDKHKYEYSFRTLIRK